MKLKAFKMNKFDEVYNNIINEGKEDIIEQGIGDFFKNLFKKPEDLFNIIFTVTTAEAKKEVKQTTTQSIIQNKNASLINEADSDTGEAKFDPNKALDELKSLDDNDGRKLWCARWADCLLGHGSNADSIYDTLEEFTGKNQKFFMNIMKSFIEKNNSKAKEEQPELNINDSAVLITINDGDIQKLAKKFVGKGEKINQENITKKLSKPFGQWVSKEIKPKIFEVLKGGKPICQIRIEGTNFDTENTIINISKKNGQEKYQKMGQYLFDIVKKKISKLAETK